jgi:protein-L-isoaspartate(D-aspartate) O-methyltransferase
MITAAVDHIPRPLLEQLKDGGRFIVPLGDPYGFQDLVLARKREGNITVKHVTGVLFVPMTGKALQ